MGDWSEHMSSSGKKYYYNCKTEVSQWEKPKEWIERERSRYKEKERDAERCYTSGSRLGKFYLENEIFIALKKLKKVALYLDNIIA